MASSCFSVYACLLIGRAGDCGEELCAQIYYLELFRADLAPNFRRSAAYHHPGGHTSWSQPGACLGFPVSPSVQEAEAAAVQPQSTMGLALGKQGEAD